MATPITQMYSKPKDGRLTNENIDHLVPSSFNDVFNLKDLKNFIQTFQPNFYSYLCIFCSWSWRDGGPELNPIENLSNKLDTVSTDHILKD